MTECPTRSSPAIVDTSGKEVRVQGVESGMVGPLRLEPRNFGLKFRCSG